MYALVEKGMQLFRRKNHQDFSDIDAHAVSMSEKFFAQLSFKKARSPLSRKTVSSYKVPSLEIIKSARTAAVMDSMHGRARIAMHGS